MLSLHLQVFLHFFSEINRVIRNWIDLEISLVEGIFLQKINMKSIY